MSDRLDVGGEIGLERFDVHQRRSAIIQAWTRQRLLYSLNPMLQAGVIRPGEHPAFGSQASVGLRSRRPDLVERLPALFDQGAGFAEVHWSSENDPVAVDLITADPITGDASARRITLPAVRSGSTGSPPPRPLRQHHQATGNRHSSGRPTLTREARTGQ